MKPWMILSALSFVVGAVGVWILGTSIGWRPTIGALCLCLAFSWELQAKLMRGDA